jgi:ABC-type spermidine/putrescine transport system permease subunit II
VRLRWKLPWLAALSAAILFFLFAPVVVIILFSFNDSLALSLPIEGLSLRWYEAIFGSPQFLSALRNTVLVGGATALLATLVGTLAAYALARYRFRYKAALTAAFTLPIALPPLFIGIALMIYFRLLSVPLSLGTVIIGHLLYTLPYLVLVLTARLQRYDWIQEEAARDLGASALQAYWRVTFPQIAPSLIGAAVLVFALSFDEFLITFFVIGHDSTLPMLIWSSMRRSLDPRVNAMAVVVLAASVLIVLLISRFLNVREIRP